MKTTLKILDWWWNTVVKHNDNVRMGAQTLPKGIKEINDIDYFGDKSKWHLMDIYRPENMEGVNLPVIIDVHGGGWMFGDKELNKNYNFSLCTRGFAVVSFSYSLFPEVTLPTVIKEIFQAINYIYDNASQYLLDTNNMFLTGDSAGGHYVGLVSSIIVDENLQKLYGVSTAASFNAIGFTCAAFYPNSIAKIPLPIAKNYVRLFYGEKKYKKSKFYINNDIINNKVERFPPMFINSCYNDMLKGQVKKFTNELDKRDIPYELVFPEKKDCVNKMKHVYSVLYSTEWEESVKTNDAICDFFKKHIK